MKASLTDIFMAVSLISSFENVSHVTLDLLSSSILMKCVFLCGIFIILLSILGWWLVFDDEPEGSWTFFRSFQGIWLSLSASFS